MAKLITTLRIDNLNVEVQISYQLEVDEHGVLGWTWTIDRIRSVELVIADKQGVDVTWNVRSKKAATDLLEKQCSNCCEQILDAIEADKAERRVA